MAILEIKNLTKIYKSKKKAVNQLTLTVDKGDIFGFIGGNGSGKTTTIKAVVGIHNINQGEIFIDGHSIIKEPLTCKSKIAYIPDHPNLYEHLTGYQYINFIADLYNVPTSKRKQRVQKYSDLFAMTPALNHVISSYSHGMKQRTAIISALVHQPKLFILDEPFIGLDPKASYLLKQVMQECVANGGAIFFSTHVLDVAEKLCNKIALIHHGKLIASGPTETVKGNQSLEAFFMEVQNI